MKIIWSAFSDNRIQASHCNNITASIFVVFQEVFKYSSTYLASFNVRNWRMAFIFTLEYNFHIRNIFLMSLYRVSKKFSDTLNELFVVNWLISHFFCDNTKWKVVSSPHYLKILLKYTKYGLSYSLKRDWKSISKITFVGGFVLA